MEADLSFLKVFDRTSRIADPASGGKYSNVQKVAISRVKVGHGIQNQAIEFHAAISPLKILVTEARRAIYFNKIDCVLCFQALS